MAINLASTGGTISYNGVTFDAGCNVRWQIVPMYDEAERTVTHVKYIMRVHGFWQENSLSTLETGMDSITDKLTAPGKTLTIQDYGFDTALTTHQSGTRPDLLWGAKPRLYALEPVGGINAYEFDWEVEFNISRCDNALSALPLMAYNYDWSVDIDDQGLSTRTINGYLQVPAVRGDNASRSLLFNVDSKWDSVAFAVPYGFKRMMNQRRVNSARNRIDFTIVDRELGGPVYPAGLVDAKIDYTMQSLKPFVRWRGSLSGSMTTAPGVSPGLAAERFFQLLNSKVAKLRRSLPGSKGQPVVIPESIRFGRGLYGPEARTSNFSVQFLIVSDIKELLSASGMYEDDTAGQYTLWAQSMSGVWNNRGVAKLVFDPASDSIVDICSGSSGYATSSPSASTSEPGGAPQRVFEAASAKYTDFRNTVKIVHKKRSLLHRLAQQYQDSPGLQTHVIEYLGAPDCYAVMIGRAIRIGIPPETPSLTSVDGKNVTEIDRQVDVRPATKLFGKTVYHANWRITYQVDGFVKDSKPAFVADNVPNEFK